MRKPRLTPQQARWIDRVDGYIRRYDCRGHQVFAAASDVFDGWLKREEVEPLVRQRLLQVFPIPADERSWTGLLGDRVTVEFTTRAVRLFWPDRLLST